LVQITLLSACARTPEPVEIGAGQQRPIIFDTDMAHEDMFAALFLLQHPNVDLKAITVAGTGEAHCQPGVRNAQGLASLAGKPDLPVACGSETPLQGSHEFPAEWRQGADSVYGIPLPANPNPPAELSAPDLIANIIAKSPEKVTLVAVGPLTNLGEALRDHPEIVENIEAIYIMGGAVDAPGNVGVSGVGIENPVAEWNIYIDPHAANLVLASGAPIVLVPLDATRDVPITRRFHNSLGKARASAAANFVYDVLSTQLDFIDSGGFQFWDTLTAAAALQDDLAEYENVSRGGGRAERLDTNRPGWIPGTGGSFGRSRAVRGAAAYGAEPGKPITGLAVLSVMSVCRSAVGSGAGMPACAVQ
ncbi:MAG: nucleoside hydrolase, partial [Anaerolineales bacterium]